MKGLARLRETQGKWVDLQFLRAGYQTSWKSTSPGGQKHASHSFGNLSGRACTKSSRDAHAAKVPLTNRCTLAAVNGSIMWQAFGSGRGLEGQARIAEPHRTTTVPIPPKTKTSSHRMGERLASLLGRAAQRGKNNLVKASTGRCYYSFVKSGFICPRTFAAKGLQPKWLVGASFFEKEASITACHPDPVAYPLGEEKLGEKLDVRNYAQKKKAPARSGPGRSGARSSTGKIQELL